MKWNDAIEIAEALEEKYPTAEILQIRFTELREMILHLENFSDTTEGCNEQRLEAILLAWLDERE